MGKGDATRARPEKKYSPKCASNFDDFLAARKSNQPWHYFFGCTTTHRAWVKGSGKKLWGIEPDALKGKMPKFLPDVPEVREDVADYLGECQAVDAYVGVLLKRLEEAGEVEQDPHRVERRSRDARCACREMQPLRHGRERVSLVMRVPGGKPRAHL